MKMIKNSRGGYQNLVNKLGFLFTYPIEKDGKYHG